MPTDPPKKRRHRWIWAVILLLFGLLFYGVFHYHAVPQDRRGPGGPEARGGAEVEAVDVAAQAVRPFRSPSPLPPWAAWASIRTPLELSLR